MKRGKTKSLRTVACPKCKLGSAVNKSDAYQAFHSKEYAERRRVQAVADRTKGPQVGKTTDIEYLLTEQAFGESIAPPKPPDSKDDYFLAMTIIVTASALAFIIVGAYNFDLDWLEVGLELSTLAVLLLYLKLEGARRKPDLTYRLRYDYTWLCLRCGYEWIKNKSLKS